ncbi:MAG: hypothetical protein C4529_11235 [Deltaproteobacteria bacterium]|nr:MAG: hypothetical protein C4529_11235 [Deltaproteobacteria bacterium]
MNARLLPWALFAAAVFALAVRSGFPGKGTGAPPVPSPAVAAADRGPDIRLWTVEVRESHDDGGWNRLVAAEAVYSYLRKTVEGTDVTVSIGTGESTRGAVLRAPGAFWDLGGKTVRLPDGGSARREGGWSGELSSATFDLAGKTLRATGPAAITGPGFTVAGTNLEWRWADGKITMDAPKSRIAPAGRPGRKG